MRTVELRRHAERDTNEDLTARGLEQCAEALAAMRFPYDLYRMSEAKRARLTMEAFGVSTATPDPRLGPRPKPPFARFGPTHEELLRSGMDHCTAWFRIPEAVPLLLENGRIGAEAVRAMTDPLPAGGRALAVSHGGTIEPIAVVLTGRTYEALFGSRELGYCEGVRLRFDEGRSPVVDVLRLGRGDA